MIKIVWADLAAVRRNDVPETVHIEIDLSFFGINQVINKELAVPKQDIELENEPESTVTHSSSGSTAVAAATTVTALVFRTVLVGALSQLWGLINGLSLFVHLPMTGL